VSNIELTEQQRAEIRAAIKHWRTDCKALDKLDIDDREKHIERLKLAKSFLDKHKETAFHYECSGRGLPARTYHSRVDMLKFYVGDDEDYKHLINNDYLSKIEVNIERYRANIKALDESLEQEGSMKRYLAGYLFKPSHTEVHYLRNKKIDGRKKYSGNFTTDRKEAYLFGQVSDFDEHLQAFLDKVNSEPNEDGYHFVMTHEQVTAKVKT